MPIQAPLFPGPPPAYKTTSAEALARLRKKGRDLAIKERVRLAIAYLQPTTRQDLYDFFEKTPFGVSMKITTISSAVNGLIMDGLVAVVGKTENRYGSRVEIIQLGLDERVKKRKGRLMEQPYLDGLEPPRRFDQRSFVAGWAMGLLTGLGIMFLMWTAWRIWG